MVVIRMQDTNMFTFLSQFTIFKSLTKSEMEPIVDIANSKRYEQGMMVFLQDEPITDVFFIQQGKVKIYKTNYDGSEQIVNVLQRDDMFPHQGFFRQGNYPAHAEILADTLLVNIPILSFENLLLTNPNICIKIFRVLGDVIVDLQQRLGEKMFYNVYEQIIRMFMRLATKNGVEIEPGIYRLHIDLTNGELANIIGTSRETISRSLTRLRKSGLVDIDKSGTYIIYYNKMKKGTLD